MRIMNLKGSGSNKNRGVERKCKTMVNSINNMTSVFPEVNMDSGFWHLHLPVSQEFIDSSKTPSKIRKICIETLVDRVKYLIDNKPVLDVSARVVACITLPNLWDSQIIVFFGETYFNGFFNRDSEYQKWIPLPLNRSFSREFNLNISREITEKGYIEEITDGDYKSTSELWFIGELS